MAFVTVWVWESVLQDDCYEIVLGDFNPERPFHSSDRRLLASRAAAVMQKIQNAAPLCGHDMTVPLYSRSWRNFFRKREWLICLLCDETIE